MMLMTETAVLSSCLKMMFQNDREDISVDFIARLKLQEVEWPGSVSTWENRTKMLEALKILVVYIHGDLNWGADAYA
jgi:hypothetical protein